MTGFPLRPAGQRRGFSLQQVPANCADRPRMTLRHSGLRELCCPNRVIALDHEAFRDGYIAGWRSVRGEAPEQVPLSPVFVRSAMYMLGFSRGARDATATMPGQSPSALGADHTRTELAHEEVARVPVDVEDDLVTAAEAHERKRPHTVLTHVRQVHRLDVVLEPVGHGFTTQHHGPGSSPDYSDSSP
jgi:hypothetical protein